MALFIYAYLLIGLSITLSMLLIDRIEHNFIGNNEWDRALVSLLTICLWPAWVLIMGTKV